MSDMKWRVALVGFGRMAAGYSDDHVMAKYYRYATHIQVLRDHPRLNLKVVIEPDPIARQLAVGKWGVPFVVPTIDELGEIASEIDIAVIATPPSARQNILRVFPALKAVLVEKPLGETVSAAENFIRECESRKLFVQVNYWRRADSGLRRLALHDLSMMIGNPVAVNCLYGNGIINNGSHIIDMVRMFFGEIKRSTILSCQVSTKNGPIEADINPQFALHMDSGIVACVNPLDFHCYRENGIMVFGDRGRLDILNEGLNIFHYPLRPNRAMDGELEIAHDSVSKVSSTVGVALYEMYENLLAALDKKNADILFSPGSSALVTSRWVDKIHKDALTADRHNGL